MQKESRVVIVGGGICGLLAAILLKRESSNLNITIIEAEKTVGGLLKSFSYEGFGCFDYGTHYLSEIGIHKIDEIFRSLFPENDCHNMYGTKADVSGVYLNDSLQTNTPFPDLRKHADASFFKSTFLNKCEVPIAETNLKDDAQKYYSERFGSAIVEQVINPIIVKIFGHSSTELSYLGTKFIPLGRILLFEDEFIHALAPDDKNTKYLAHSDQRIVPATKLSLLRAFYPKQPGIQHFIDKMLSELEAIGVKVLTACQLKKLTMEKGSVTSIEIKHGEAEVILHCDEIIWSAGPLTLSKLILPDFSFIGFDKPLKTALVHLVLDRPMDCFDLYYFYCYEANYKTFRVTNYKGFCPASDGYKYTVELFLDGSEVDSIEDLACNELKLLKLISSDSEVLFKKAEVLTAGFPLLTLKNQALMDSYKKRILSQKIQNLTMCGVDPTENVFFMREVIADMHTKVMTLLQKFK